MKEKFHISFEFEFTDVSPEDELSIQKALNDWAENQRQEFMNWNDGTFKSVEWKPELPGITKTKKKSNRKKKS